MKIKNTIRALWVTLTVFVMNAMAANNNITIEPSLVNGKSEFVQWVPYATQMSQLLDLLYYIDAIVAIAVILWCAVQWKRGGIGHLEAEVSGRKGMKTVIIAVIVLKIALVLTNALFTM
jgi:hypothetical protein